ncbi:DNA topoisomerase I [Citrobacter koseri]|nr:DNA topoisomerase I [Citrobacter koseri]
MGKALVIVESPAKAKTINSIWVMITWLSPASVISVICRPVAQQLKRAPTLPPPKRLKSPKKDERGALVNRMGVDPWHNWDAHYEVLPGKEKVVSELKQLAEKADHIYLATTLTAKGKPLPGTCGK